MPSPSSLHAVQTTIALDPRECSFPGWIGVTGSRRSMKLPRWIFLSLALLIGTIPPFAHVVDAFSMSDGPNKKKEMLNVAFVTGNEMKVREIEMILTEEGAIDMEHPEDSLGECDFQPRHALDFFLPG